jgi:hypothetical protein
MGTRVLNAFDHRSRYSFGFSLLLLGLGFPGGWGAPLFHDVCMEMTMPFLSAALEGHGHMVRCLNGIENILATLRVIERGAVDCCDQIARFQPQLIEYLPISARIGAKAAKSAGGVVVRRHGAHDLIENSGILLHQATDVVYRRDRARVRARATYHGWSAHARAQQPRQQQGLELAASVENDMVEIN